MNWRPLAAFWLRFMAAWATVCLLTGAVLDRPARQMLLEGCSRGVIFATAMTLGRWRAGRRSAPPAEGSPPASEPRKEASTPAN
jgi:hypothetical protein